LSINSSVATTPKFPSQDHCNSMHQKSSFSAICTHFCVTGLPPQRKALHILSLFFKMVNSAEEVIPYHLHISLFDKPPTSYSRIISPFVIRSKHLHFIGIIRPKCTLNFNNTKRNHIKMFHSCSPSKWHNETATSSTKKTDQRILYYEHFLLANS
jgi:hypothetical protein